MYHPIKMPFDMRNCSAASFCIAIQKTTCIQDFAKTQKNTDAVIIFNFLTIYIIKTKA